MKKSLIITDKINHAKFLDLLPEKSRSEYELKSYDEIVEMAQETADLYGAVWQDSGEPDLLYKFSKAKSLKFTEEGIDWEQPKSKILADIVRMPDFVPSVDCVDEIQEDVKDYDKFVFSTGQPSSAPTNLTIWKPINEQRRIVAEIFAQLEDNKIVGVDISDLSEKISDLCKATDLFLVDIYSDKVHSVLLSGNRKATLEEAKNVFLMHFKRNCYVKGKITTNSEGVRKQTLLEVKIDEFSIIWNAVVSQAKYSERIRYMESLPEWDGVPRIGTFMKEYYNCDVCPNFFLLLYTHIVGKMINPEENNCPYFFDISGESEGTGKSTLARMLVGGNDYHFAGNFSNAVDGKGRSSEDFINKCYAGNNAVVIDDELAWEESKVFNNETFKAFVTYQQDTFSKKNKPEQTLARTFITIRTSNSIRNVYSVDGRRQIIFDVNLKPRELRIINAPKDIFKLLLCEAYAYYKKHGLYELTPEEKEEQVAQNKKYYNFDDENMTTVQDYIFEISRRESSYISDVNSPLGICGDWGKYQKFCKSNKDKALYGPIFWQKISTLSKFKEKGIIYRDEDQKTLIKKVKGTRVQYFIVKMAKENADILPDLPY